jgi:hypothetical protein
VRLKTTKAEIKNLPKTYGNGQEKPEPTGLLFVYNNSRE